MAFASPVGGWVVLPALLGLPALSSRRRLSSCLVSQHVVACRQPFLFFLSQRTNFCIPFPVDAFDAFNVSLLGVYFYLDPFFGVAMTVGSVLRGVWLALLWIRDLGLVE